MQLTFDETIYPRGSVDEDHIKTLMEAIRAGRDLGSIIATEDGRIIDGVHRQRAYQQLGITPPVEVIESEDELLEAARRNSAHGRPLSQDEKKAVALACHEGHTLAELEEALAIPDSTLSRWLAEPREKAKAERDGYIREQRALGRAQADIAQEIGLTDRQIRTIETGSNSQMGKTSAIDWQQWLKPYTLWNFAGLSPLFGQQYPGRLPGQLLVNVLHWFTEEGAIVVDPFAGGGTTQDVAVLMKRQCHSYDLVPARDFIEEWDTVTDGPPPHTTAADLVFFDPPYGHMKQGDCSDHETNLANYTSGDFLDIIAALAHDFFAAMKPGALAAFIIADLAKDGERVPLGIECYNRFRAAGFQHRDLIDVPHSTQQYQAFDVTRAKEAKTLLLTHRLLFVVEKAE